MFANVPHAFIQLSRERERERKNVVMQMTI